jgi:hypothetical protein
VDPERLLSFAYGGVLIVSCFLFVVIGRVAVAEVRRGPLAKNSTFVIALSLALQCVALIMIGFARVDDHLSNYLIAGRWPTMLSWAMVLLLLAKVGFHWAATIGSRRGWQWLCAVFFLIAWGAYSFVL